MKYKLFRICAFAALLFAVCGCASSSGGTRAIPLRSYEGDALPPRQAATLRSREPVGFGGITVRLFTINGKLGPNRTGWGNAMNGSFYVELAPGEVSLSVGYSGVSYFPAALQYSTDSPTVSFTAESGHEYVLDVELSADRWQPTLLDSTTHKQIH